MMSSLRRIMASTLVALFLTAALAAEAQAPNEMRLHAYALKYRRAGEALTLVSPLLSANGTVELQPGSNTLVIRDTAAALQRILPLLRSYDHPARPLTLEMYIVRASRSQVSPAVPHSDLPEGLTRKLRGLLAYDIYEVQAQAQLVSQEGQAVTYALAEDYQVSFRLGNLLGDQQVKLSDFRIVRRSDRRAAGLALIHTNLNLWLDQTTSLGLARSESSPEALMVVLTLRNGDVARRLQKEPQ
jgi:type II secretory pathway component GspD/PulD (secretin)